MLVFIFFWNSANHWFFISNIGRFHVQIMCFTCGYHQGNPKGSPKKGETTQIEEQILRAYLKAQLNPRDTN